jgi:hypothetical protein
MVYAARFTVHENSVALCVTMFGVTQRATESYEFL